MNKADLRRKKKPGKGGYTCSWICTGVSFGTVCLFYSFFRRRSASYGFAAAYILFPDSIIFGDASWFYRFVRSLCEIAGVLLIPCLFFSIRMYIAKERNMKRLYQIYRSADEEEIRAVDTIREGRPAFVFTKEYMVNWDGSLHIIPLKEIETIMYRAYFYLLIYGTKLVVRDRRGKHIPYGLAGRRHRIGRSGDLSR